MHKLIEVHLFEIYSKGRLIWCRMVDAYNRHGSNLTCFSKAINDDSDITRVSGNNKHIIAFFATFAAFRCRAAQPCGVQFLASCNIPLKTVHRNGVYLRPA